MALLTHPILSFPQGKLSIVPTVMCWFGFVFALASAFTCEFFTRVVRVKLENLRDNSIINFERDVDMGLWYYKGDIEDSNLQADRSDTDCHPYSEAFSEDHHIYSAQICNLISLIAAMLISFYLLLMGCRLVPSKHRKMGSAAIFVALVFQNLGYLVFQGYLCENEAIKSANENLVVTDFSAHCRIGNGAVLSIIASVFWLIAMLSLLAVKDTEEQNIESNGVVDLGVNNSEENGEGEGIEMR